MNISYLRARRALTPVRVIADVPRCRTFTEYFFNAAQIILRTVGHDIDIFCNFYIDMDVLSSPHITV